MSKVFTLSTARTQSVDPQQMCYYKNEKDGLLVISRHIFIEKRLWFISHMKCTECGLRMLWLWRSGLMGAQDWKTGESKYHE